MCSCKNAHKVYICVCVCVCAEEHLMMATGEQLCGVWVHQRERPDRGRRVWLDGVSGLKQETLKRSRSRQADCGGS